MKIKLIAGNLKKLISSGAVWRSCEVEQIPDPRGKGRYQGRNAMRAPGTQIHLKLALEQYIKTNSWLGDFWPRVMGCDLETYLAK